MSALRKMLDAANDLATRMEQRAADLAPVEIEWKLENRPDRDAKILRGTTRTVEGKEYCMLLELPNDVDLSEPEVRKLIMGDMERKFRYQAQKDGVQLAPPRDKPLPSPMQYYAVVGNGSAGGGGGGSVSVGMINNAINMMREQGIPAGAQENLYRQMMKEKEMALQKQQYAKGFFDGKPY